MKHVNPSVKTYRFVSTLGGEENGYDELTRSLKSNIIL